MISFFQLRSRLSLWHIRKISAVNKRIRPFDPENIEQIGIVVNPLDQGHQDFSLQPVHALKVKKKQVEVLGYMDSKTLEKPVKMPVISKNEFDWQHKPKNMSIKNFIDRRFDILINFSAQMILPLEYICAVSKAKYIVGNSTNHLHENYDCLIQLNDDDSPSNFMENMSNYLGIKSLKDVVL